MFCRDLPIQMCQEQLRRRWKEMKVLQKVKASGIKEGWNHHHTNPTTNQNQKKISRDINVAWMQHATMCSRDTWNVSQFAVAFVYSLVVGAKLTLASCIHLHSLTFDSQSCVCNSCVFSQFSHLGDRKTPILTIKKTRTRTFK